MTGAVKDFADGVCKIIPQWWSSSHARSRPRVLRSIAQAPLAQLPVGNALPWSCVGDFIPSPVLGLQIPPTGPRIDMAGSRV